MATTPGGLPYPVGTDKVVDGDDAIRALALALDPYIQAGTNQVRATDLTISPGVWGDLAGVITGYPVRAGVRYRVIGTGALYVGGANADVTHKIIAGASAGPGFAINCLNAVKIGVANQMDFVAAATTTINVSFQVFGNSPATGVVMLAGSSVSIGVAS